MCFYDVILMTCNCWKWGHFRQHCAKEYRTGETCGIRLTNETTQIGEKCKICKKIDSKQKAIYKEESNIARWKKERHGRSASIEKSQEMIRELQLDVMELERERNEKLNNLSGGRSSIASGSYYW